MVLDTSASLVPPRPNLWLDEVKLGSYLEQRIPGFQPSSLQVFQFSHGQSNPTYLLKTATANYVLRKKPPPPILPSAHAIEREYQVLEALKPTTVPVPEAVVLCEDPSIIGTPFYVMQHVKGRIFDDPSLPSLTPAQRAMVYHSMATTLATLHNVPPAAVGLQNYGAPQGYNRRQVNRWSAQYLKSVAPGEQPMPEMLQVMDSLKSRIPASDADASLTRVSHGDYRMDNLVFDGVREDRILAVLDWELSTLGDPLADLAYNCMPYHLPSDLPGLMSLSPPLPPGIPTEQQYIQIYCKARGIAYPLQADWPFYLALSIFRLASILAGVGARAKQGNASSGIASAMGADTVVHSLACTALRIINSNSSGNSSPNASAPEKQLAIGNGLDNKIGLGPSERVKPILAKLKTFMQTKVYPAEPMLNAHAMSDRRWTIHPLQEQLKSEAKSQGLWNLWIPEDMARSLTPLVRSSVFDGQEAALLLGPGLSNLEYAHCAEIMGASVWAPECFNCSAPDTGNMEVLARYGNDYQKKEWLLGLMRGDYRSCFAMTEPAVASSDATNIQSSITRNGNSYILNGRKWWISGACDPRCKIAIFMGKSDPTASTHTQQSMVLVPLSTPGVTIVRPLPVLGFDDAPHGHAEMTFENVQVPLSNVILGEGRGFEIAQGRLGPGRLHHCMRLIGQGERAIELMLKRAGERTAFGQTLGRHQAVRIDVANSRVELNAARLVVLDAAHDLDQVGNKAARGKIAAAKALAPIAVLKIIDRAIQIHGGAGVGNTTPLAHMYATARTLRLADGPDIVHLETIAKMELTAYRRSKL